MFLVILTRFLYHLSIIFIIFLVIGGFSCYSTRINITRANDSLDIFTIERTNCSKSLCSSKRSNVYKSTPSSCTCRCISNATTFVLQGDLANSVCVDNGAIRSTLGQCKLLLGSNRTDSPLSVLDISTSGSKVLEGFNGSSVCSVYREEFLDKGAWFNLTTTFTIDNNLLKWLSVPNSSYAGHIVRVHLECGVDKPCIVLKIQGTISYNISGDQPIGPIQPSPTPSRLGSTSRHFTSSKTKPATSISPSLATVAIVTSSAILIDTGGTKAVLEECERGTGVFCQRFYLAMAVVGVVVLVVVGIISISCACIRRRRRRNLHHQKPVFFKSGLTKETDDPSTELALIEDAKPGNEEHNEQNTEEAFYQNVPRREKPDKSQSYRPLRSSDGQDSPTTPASPGRFSYGSSTNDVTLYDDDTTDSNQLISKRPGSKSPKPGNQFNTFCPSPVVQPNNGILSKQVVLDSDEEPTYEIMETMILPSGGEAKRESINGIENQVFEEDDDNRRSDYEITDDEPNYENLHGDYIEEQTNYETMEEQLPCDGNGLGLNEQQGNKSYSDDDEEQIDYEKMATYSRKEQPDYVIMEHNEKTSQQETMGSHSILNCESDYNKKEEEMENEREYDIPELILDEADPNYDIPEQLLSGDLQEDTEENDYHYTVNTSGPGKNTGLTVPGDIGNDDDNDNEDADYIYANVPETQANALRERLRNSWHPGGQRGGENTSGSQTAVEKSGVEKRPSSWNTTPAGKRNKETAHEDDSEELYTLPDEFPKPLPSFLLKGKSSPQLKGTQSKDLKQNEASPKQKQRSSKANGVQRANDQIKPKRNDTEPCRGAVSNRADPGSPKRTQRNPEKSQAPDGRVNKNKTSLGQESDGKASAPEGRGTEKGKPVVDNQEHSSTKEMKSPKKAKESSLNKPKSEDGFPSRRSKEKPLRQTRQPGSGNKASVTPQNEMKNHRDTEWNQDDKTTGKEQTKQEQQFEGLANEQPLYTNLVEMENERRPLSANQNSNSTEDVHENLNDTSDDEQPLYENVGAMVNRVG